LKQYHDIVTVGVKKGTDLLAYYAASDCFVLPSYREGFPNTVLEAGALGLPCIVTDVNGSREIIKDGYNGLIVPSHDIDALFSAMKEMVDQPEKRGQMASVARNHIASHYEQGFVNRCQLEYYYSIIKES
jgi:glycosyltransferase involved in cell wall biosynthesis